MGKIVKFCSSCEEGFAEKFSFCPNCASELSAFEMKPIVETPPVVEEKAVVEEPILETADVFDVKSDVLESPPIAYDDASVTSNQPEVDKTPQIVKEEAVFEPISFLDNSSNGFDNSVDLISDDILELEVEEPVKEEEVFVTEDFNEPFEETEEVEETQRAVFLPEEPIHTYETNNRVANDDGFHVTVVSEEGGKVRNGLLLFTFALITFGFVGLVIYSLFSNLDNVASLNEDEVLVALLNETPTEIEEPEKKKDDDDGGGGGGGGKENPKPVSRGELPSQQRMLMPPPQVVPRLDNPELRIINRTQGDIKRDRNDRVGLPNGLSDDASSGPGSGGGIGTGRGSGVGSGFGTGEGSGNGSGSGSGSGNGNGSGTGNGSGSGIPGPPPPPKPKKVGPTVGIKILSKPKPGYTDAARQNNVRGVVRVRVAFLANGSIGGVSVVQGLPDGLTEKALAAARQIRFEPPMRNGEPYSVNKVVQFNFNIY